MGRTIKGGKLGIIYRPEFEEYLVLVLVLWSYNTGIRKNDAIFDAENNIE